MVRDGEERLLTMRGYPFVSVEEFAGCLRYRRRLHYRQRALYGAPGTGATVERGVTDGGSEGVRRQPDRDRTIYGPAGLDLASISRIAASINSGSVGCLRLPLPVPSLN